MSKNEARVHVLEHQIIDHQRAYDTGDPTISDAAFDRLQEELKLRAPRSRVLQHLGAPKTQVKMKHSPRMLSLGKTYTIQGVLDWAKDIRGGFVVQPKYDGVAVSAHYVNGRATLATRGDGDEGDVIVPWVPRIPVVERGDAVIRGELLIPKRAFEDKWSSKYANARNMIAGLVGVQKRTAEGLEDSCFCPHWHSQLMEPEHQSYQSFWTSQSSLLWVSVKHWRFCDSINGLEEILESLNPVDVPFDIDGWVIRADQLSEWSRLGETAHHPRWAIALKLQGDSGVAMLEDVVWETSKHGAITPVAVFSPTKLSGASLTHATLHHRQHFDELDLRKGDEVLITRRGGVIPHVESVKSCGGGERFEAPGSCVCGAPTTNLGLRLVCSSHSSSMIPADWPCVGSRREAIQYYFKTCGVLGFGPDVVMRCDTVGMTSLADYYSADDKDFRIAGCGEKQTATLLAEIDKIRKLDAAVFLTALGVPLYGPTTIRKNLEQMGPFYWAHPCIAQHTHFLQDLPPSFAHSVWARGATTSKMATSLYELLTRHVSLTWKQGQGLASAGKAFQGESIVFTGPLSDMSRDEAQRAARSFGAETPSSVTKSTTMLVVGDRASDAQRTKRDRAKALNLKGAKINILTETEWVALLLAAQDKD